MQEAADRTGTKYADEYLCSHTRTTSPRSSARNLRPSAPQPHLPEALPSNEIIKADYVFGWKGDALQQAMDSGCYINNCRALTSQTAKVKNQCAVQNTVQETIDGCRCTPLHTSVLAAVLCTVH